MAKTPRVQRKLFCRFYMAFRSRIRSRLDPKIALSFPERTVRYCVCCARASRALFLLYLQFVESSRDQYDRFSRVVRARGSCGGCNGRVFPAAAIRVAGRVTRHDRGPGEITDSRALCAAGAGSAGRLAGGFFAMAPSPPEGGFGASWRSVISTHCARGVTHSLGAPVCG